MKKIKFLLLIFPLLFIINVKAENCDSVVDLTTASSSTPSSNGLTILGPDSFIFNDTTGSINETFYIRYFFGLSNGTYIVTFDVTDKSSQWDTARSDFIHFKGNNNSDIVYSRLSTFDEVNHLKYQIFVNNAMRMQFYMYGTTDKNPSTLKVENFKVLSLENYNACYGSSESGGDDMVVDFSAISPYLILICFLLIFMIVKDFIKSVLKSRR